MTVRSQEEPSGRVRGDYRGVPGGPRPAQIKAYGAKAAQSVRHLTHPKRIAEAVADFIVEFSKKVTAALQRIANTIGPLEARLKSLVEGPSSSTDNGLARWDRDSGKKLQDTVEWTLEDDGELRSTIADGTTTLQDPQIQLLNNTAGGHVKIRLNANSNVADFWIDVDDGDDRWKVVHEGTLGTQTEILMADSGGNVVLHLNTSAPADAALDNNTAIFWYDSTGPSIEVKHKDGSGTVRSGTVSSIS